MEKIFLKNLKTLNFILACLTVFHHAFNMDISYCIHSVLSFTFIVERYMYNVSECAVPMFFFVSGYLFFRTYENTWGVLVQAEEKILFSFDSIYYL